MINYRRLKMHFLNHKVKLIVTLAVLVVVGLAIWGMSSLESYYRNITLATMPLQLLVGAVHAMIFVFMYLVFLRGGFAKLDKKNLVGKDVSVKFSDVIGIDEAKEESWEVVHLIKDHFKLKKIGGKILRGILMLGPPGCGKTYLAKAIATESGLPFLAMAASEFNEVFVGVGSSRVRSLFKRAKSLAYGFGGCIVFIDELDAMGQRRTFNQFGGAESNNTQNQLLVEMDGLSSNEENIVIIGATNASEDILDEALLRPGRFDRKVYIRKPNLEGREALFEHYFGKVAYEKGIDFKKLARISVDKSPAEIENIVKESALLAIRNKNEAISWKEISEALERIELGVKQRLTMVPKEREMTAYHETGHLIVTYLLHPRNDVFKASIIPRKGSLGVVYGVSIEEWHGYDRETFLAYIKSALAGYVAEKIKFKTTTTGVGGGAGSDFAKAMNMAHAMVWSYGMGYSGLVGDYDIYRGDRILMLSEEIKLKLNKDVDKILKDCMSEVEALLTGEKELFERFAKELLKKDELEYDEIEAIFMEFGKANPRRFSLPKGDQETIHTSENDVKPNTPDEK